ncbi:transglutaminaseTgpA domain-containing protein [Priestia koreensis]|uniref:transglutaminaseTgpA domain-containing protein n=1 Tax=Priestia koreensis TaxID=284581 RepID=UPI00345899DE
MMFKIPFERRNPLLTVVMYMGIFVLLYTWIKPISEVTSTASAMLFTVFIILNCFLSFLRVSVWMSFITKWLYIFYSLHYWYFDNPLFDFTWVGDLFQTMGNDFSLIGSFNISSISNEFRSILFFILLWLVSYLLIYWVFYQKRIFTFIVLSVVYIAVLDTFTTYDGKSAIITMVLIGLLFVGILRIERVGKLEFSSKAPARKLVFILPFILVLLVSTTIAYALPKAKPQWPDPVPFLKSYAQGNEGEGTGSGSIRKIGYGTDDSRLGGSFVGDDSVVFGASVSEKHYWRIETKDTYTGKGWVQSEIVGLQPIEQTLQSEQDANGGREAHYDVRSMLSQYPDKVTEKVLEDDVIPAIQNPFYMYAPSTMSIMPRDEMYTNLKINAVSQKIYNYEGSQQTGASAYTIRYKLPKFPVEELQKPIVKDQNENNDEFMKRYTQLPKTLPKRVRDLAKEITAGETNRYDQVNKIKQYFEYNPYSYDTQDVGIPGKNQDYVDQFLFDTKRGYCDNFSTSTIVLLRSLGIPARWVKGYTAGDVVGEEGDRTLYQVTQNNAHSWVEVYFPGTGWIPFEPTKSFSAPEEFSYNLTTTTGAEQNDTPAQRNLAALNKQKKQESKLAKEASATPQTDESNTWNKKTIFYVILGMIMVLVASIVIYLKRRRWLPLFLIRKYRHKRSKNSMSNAYLALLKQLEKYGLKRKPDQTLREYAKLVDQSFGTNEMSRLTERYEYNVYRKDAQNAEWEKSIELWENLIKKTSS